jgi:hypothetical protein
MPAELLSVLEWLHEETLQALRSSSDEAYLKKLIRLQELAIFLVLLTRI